MIYIGCHLSVTDGYKAMGETMSRFGGNTFAWFTRNPRGGRTKPVDPLDVEALKEYLMQSGFGPLVAHGSYTMNLCSAKEETRANGRDMLRQDLSRMELLPGNPEEIGARINELAEKRRSKLSTPSTDEDATSKEETAENGPEQAP